MMDALYHQTNNLLQQTQQCFQRLEGDPASVEQTEREIQSKIDSLNGNCERLDLMVFKLPMAHRQNAKMRCDQLKYDCKHLKAALTAAQQKRMRKEQAAYEREQLLNRRFAPNSEEFTINLDHAVQQQNSMHQAHRGVDEMLQTGVNALDSLRSQRMTLKGAHRKIVDMANTLGLSTHTMRLIEKRASEDKIILFAGFAITCVVITCVIIFLT